MVKKEHFLFRTKGKVSDNRQIKSSNSQPAAGRCPKEFFFHKNHVCSDGFFFILFTPGVAWGYKKLAFQAETCE
jgi:hypothetical protein